MDVPWHFILGSITEICNIIHTLVILQETDTVGTTVPHDGLSFSGLVWIFKLPPAYGMLGHLLGYLRDQHIWSHRTIKVKNKTIIMAILQKLALKVTLALFTSLPL